MARKPSSKGSQSRGSDDNNNPHNMQQDLLSFTGCFGDLTPDALNMPSSFASVDATRQQSFTEQVERMDDRMMFEAHPLPHFSTYTPLRGTFPDGHQRITGYLDDDTFQPARTVWPYNASNMQDPTGSVEPGAQPAITYTAPGPSIQLTRLTAATLNDHLLYPPAHVIRNSDQIVLEDVQDLASQAGRGGTRHQCTICGQILDSSKAYTRHIDRSHAMKSPCEFCGKLIKKRADNYKRHKLKHCAAYRKREGLSSIASLSPRSVAMSRGTSNVTSSSDTSFLTPSSQSTAGRSQQETFQAMRQQRMDRFPAAGPSWLPIFMYDQDQHQMTLPQLDGSMDSILTDTTLVVPAYEQSSSDVLPDIHGHLYESPQPPHIESLPVYPFSDVSSFVRPRRNHDQGQTLVSRDQQALSPLQSSNSGAGLTTLPIPRQRHGIEAPSLRATPSALDFASRQLDPLLPSVMGHATMARGFEDFDEMYARMDVSQAPHVSGTGVLGPSFNVRDYDLCSDSDNGMSSNGRNAQLSHRAGKRRR